MTSLDDFASPFPSAELAPASLEGAPLELLQAAPHAIATIMRDAAKKILTAMHLPTEVPELHPARPPPGTAGAAGGQEEAGESWLN